MAEAGEATRSFLADLPQETRSALADLEGTPIADRDPRAQLDAVFQAVTPYSFETGALIAYADSRWFSTQSPAGAGAPLLELRRWPGDTALALYVLDGPFGPERQGGPPFAGADLAMEPQSIEERVEWRGTIATDAGERDAIWIEIEIPGEGGNLGALLLPGDAGLGAVGADDLTTELRAVLDRVRLHPEQWPRLPGIAPGVNLLVPLMGGTPGDKSESEEPWQVAQGSSFTIGLPPGFRARRMDGAVPAPIQVPGGLLWLRGRFRDMAGQAVAVGDDQRAGYVAEVRPLRNGWANGKEPPLGAPRAKASARRPYTLAAERTRANSAVAERWSEPEFSGEWLLFRLVFDEYGLEIALPVLEGRRSAALFWIPATWRPPDRPPAPPPVDPAERFGIRFERLRPSERSRQPWMEGYLDVPGFRAEVPKGWFPAASLRSHDGYPIRLMDGEGVTRGRLVRLTAGEIPAVAEPSSLWQEMKKPGTHRAESFYQTADGRALFIAREGHAFLLEPAEADAGELWRLLVQSIQLQRSTP
jgi:hypothetical protein